MPPDSPCPSADLLRRSLDPDDPMTGPERQRIETHVERCDRGCKAAIDALLRGDALPAGPAETVPGDAPGDAPAERPARLGRYRVVDVLGSGAFGTVYRGRDDDLQRDVAVKALHRSRVARPEDAEAYLAEARAAAALDHPNIVPVYDLGRTDDGLCFVVSRFVEGGDLSRRLREARPSFAEAAALVAAVADALHNAHTHGLVHRDVKPANILIDPSGVPFLTDFGLALRDEDQGRGARLLGTPAYMSPEQARGEGHRVDGRSDIFSLGAVLYELLTGRRPFRGDSEAEILEQVVSFDARPPRQIDDALPAELERVCLKALAKRASDRYTTARDLADDLRHFLAGETREDQSPSAGRKTIRPAAAADPSAATAPAGRPVTILPKGLRSFDARDADFFLELLPGPRDRDGLPASIRFWKSRIEEADPDEAFTVGLLYGPSGCGKSSLVKAGLLPRLSAGVIAVYVEATAGETEARLLGVLRKRCAGLPAGLGLKDALAALRRGQGLAAGKKVLIVLDQFEQWLHGRKEDPGAELVQALRQCDGGRLQCLVLVRDDFWLAVSRFMRQLEVEIVQSRNIALVDLFDLDHARKVLAAYGRAFGKMTDDGGAVRERKDFLTQAASGLSQGGKVVCVRLALFAEMMKGRPWTPAALKEVGGAEGVGVAFLEDAFSSPTANPGHRLHQKAARAVLQALLPESGADIKGHMRSYRELLEASGYAGRPADFDALIRILDSEIRLITPTDPEGRDEAESAGARPAGERYYQLTHDYLVPSLRDWLTRKRKETRRGRAELLLADRAAIWNARPENRQLPSLFQWLQIRCLTLRKNWAPPQRKMMRKAARYHGVRVLAAAVLLVLVGWGAYEGYGRLEAQALRDRLLNANTEDVPLVISDMAPYRRWTEALLREAYQEAKERGDARQQLHVSLALLPGDPGQVSYLYGRLLDADPEEVGVLVQELAGYKEELVRRLWLVVERPEAGCEDRELRAAAALAAYDPDNPRWDGVAGPVAERLVAVDAAFLPAWKEALRPVRVRLLGPLAAAFRDHTAEHAAECVMATSLLADYAADRPEALADLLPDADERQFGALFPRVEANPEPVAAALRETVGKSLKAEKTDEDKERLARRQANAAVALLRLGQADAVWPLLKHGPDPRVRSFLIHSLGPRGVKARAVIQQLDQEADVSIRRALLLTLGEFGPDQLAEEERERLIPRVLRLFREDPDAGLHGAADWLLRQWGKGDQLREIERGWAADRPRREGREELIRGRLGLPKRAGRVEGFWYVNGQGQTMVVVPEPGAFVIGSPPTEVGREGGPEGEVEKQARKRIGRSFALAAREVTVEEFLHFCKDFDYRGHFGQDFVYSKAYSPTPDCPVNSVSWYDAAAYCNWLSRQEGIPEDQWCYEPATGKPGGEKYADGMKLAPDYLRRTGYRLPTEAEWEYACRAGSATSRYYGESEGLLGRYAWYYTNSRGRGMLPGEPGVLGVPGGCLKPNDLGLFNMLGNDWGWCQGQPSSYTDGEDVEEGDREIKDANSRVLRGGAFDDRAMDVRSADRSWYRPSHISYEVAFRPARTFH